MMDFANKLQFSDQKYQTNGNIRDRNYKENFLFTMKEFVSFRIYRQPMYFMSTGLLKYNIDGD